MDEKGVFMENLYLISGDDEYEKNKYIEVPISTYFRNVQIKLLKCKEQNC